MKTFAYIAISGVLATAFVSGCSEKDIQSDIDQSNREQGDIDRSDINRLQGTWQIVSVEQMGKPTGTFANHKVVIEDNTLTFMRGDELAYTGIIMLDASKQPKTLDMELISDKESQLNGRVSQGIYVVEGDTFKWCNAGPGVDDRPSEFFTNEEKNHMLLILKREKK